MHKPITSMEILFMVLMVVHIHVMATQYMTTKGTLGAHTETPPMALMDPRILPMAIRPMTIKVTPTQRMAIRPMALMGLLVRNMAILSIASNKPHCKGERHSPSTGS